MKPRWTSLLLPFFAAAASAAEPEEVVFPGGNLELHGFIHRPKGGGPFPAILYNHGSEPRPGTKPELGQLFSDKGYVFFVPHRRGQGRSPADGRVLTLGALAVNELQLEDQLAALSYLKGLSYVDAGRIAVAGCSFGGIQTILAVEANSDRNLGLRAAVDFAGAAETWARSAPLRQKMIAAVRKATVPVMFVQARNDYDLTPSYTLAKELENLGKPHKLSIYPPYGNSVQDGHGGFCFRGGAAVWGPEVLDFLDAQLKK
jgi:carboxymethylenebutenolidase